MRRPSTPRFTAITTSIDAGGEPALRYRLEPGAAGAAVVRYRIAHRRDLAGAWSEAVIPAASGGGMITGYQLGELVQMRCRAIAGGGGAGPWSLPVVLSVGQGASPLPAPLDPESVTISTLLGGVLIQLATGPDRATGRIAVYRTYGEVADPGLAVIEAFEVRPLQSFSFALGDTTRSNLIRNPGFERDGDWVYGPGWSRGEDHALHAAGEFGRLAQMQELVAGRIYRAGWETSGHASGSVLAGLGTGQQLVDPAPPATASGLHRARLQSKPGDDRLIFAADAAFAGRIDNVTLYPETPGCLPAGRHHIWLQPQNGDGVPGPLCGPFTIEVI